MMPQKYKYSGEYSSVVVNEVQGTGVWIELYLSKLWKFKSDINYVNNGDENIIKGRSIPYFSSMKNGFAIEFSNLRNWNDSYHTTLTNTFYKEKMEFIVVIKIEIVIIKQNLMLIF
jgi:hypothetical protein